MICNVCGRQVEVSDSGQTMPCGCINHPLGKVIWGAISDCVGPAVCDRCGTTVGVVAGLCDACTSPRDCIEDK